MLQEGVLDACKTLLRQQEVMDRRKGLLAISAIVRGYTPAMIAFCKDPELLTCTLAQVRSPVLRPGSTSRLRVPCCRLTTMLVRNEACEGYC